jgi:hypothetical protein
VPFGDEILEQGPLDETYRAPAEYLALFADAGRRV